MNYLWSTQCAVLFKNFAQLLNMECTNHGVRSTLLLISFCTWLYSCGFANLLCSLLLFYDVETLAFACAVHCPKMCSKLHNDLQCLGFDLASMFHIYLYGLLTLSCTAFCASFMLPPSALPAQVSKTLPPQDADLNIVRLFWLHILVDIYHSIIELEVKVTYLILRRSFCFEGFIVMSFALLWCAILALLCTVVAHVLYALGHIFLLD